MSISLHIPEPWHYRNWEPVLRHLPDAELAVQPWFWRGEGPAAQAAADRTLSWLRSKGVRSATREESPLEHHVFGTLAIQPRMVTQGYCRQVRMLYAVTHKGYTYGEHNKAYDCVMVASRFGKRRLDATGVRAEVVGCPKLDDHFNGALNRESARRQLGISPDATVVLYAPTFQDGCTYEQFEAGFADLPGDVELLLQLHPVSYLTEPGRFGTMPTRTRLVPEYENSIASLIAADVVLADYGGVIYECSAIDRPVILLDHPNAPEPEGDDPELLHREAGERITKPQELWPAIARALDDPDRHTQARAEYAGLFFDHQGTAGRRAAEVLKGLENEARETRWRDIDLIYNRMRVLEAHLPNA